MPGRTFTGRVKDVVDWPKLAWWMRRGTEDTLVREGQLFEVVVELDEEPPLCVGMSATVEVFAPPDGEADAGASGSDNVQKEGAADGQTG